MRSLTMRCSSLGKIMGEQRSKADGPLSATARSHIREIAAQEILGIDFVIQSRQFDKGNQCEPDAIALVNRVRGLKLTKNTERRTANGLTGECDLFDPETREGRDTKCAWNASTFPAFVDDITSGTLAGLYEWQCRGYMLLWDSPRWHLDYCLLDTPPDLIGYEPASLHVVGHIPEHMRLTTWTIERDAVKEALIATKISAAQDYYARLIQDFERTHPPGVFPNGD
jgi:hypothetical protein